MTIDLNEKTIYIKNSQKGSENSILDYRGHSFNFEEIDCYSIEHYESFYFNTFYLVKIHVDGDEIKLLSFRDAQEFTDLIGLLKDELNLPLK